jgi:hypothetical protein
MMANHTKTLAWWWSSLAVIAVSLVANSVMLVVFRNPDNGSRPVAISLVVAWLTAAAALGAFAVVCVMRLRVGDSPASSGSLWYSRQPMSPEGVLSIVCALGCGVLLILVLALAGWLPGSFPQANATARCEFGETGSWMNRRCSTEAEQLVVRQWSLRAQLFVVLVFASGLWFVAAGLGTTVRRRERTRLRAWLMGDYWLPDVAGEDAAVDDEHGAGDP